MFAFSSLPPMNGLQMYPLFTFCSAIVYSCVASLSARVPYAWPSVRSACTEGAHSAGDSRLMESANGRPLGDIQRRQLVGGATQLITMQISRLCVLLLPLLLRGGQTLPDRWLRIELLLARSIADLTLFCPLSISRPQLLVGRPQWSKNEIFIRTTVGAGACPPEGDFST